MIWTRYGRWTDDRLCVLNAYGQVIYRRPEWRPLPQALELRKAGVADSQVVPLTGHENQVAQDTFKALVNEQRKRAWRY